MKELSIFSAISGIKPRKRGRMNEPLLINDPRLASDMDMTWVGNTFLFRRKGLDNHFTTEDNAYVILKHGEQEYYPKLINDEWHWVNGCDKCNGVPRDTHLSNTRCKKHDVCVTCSIKRSSLTEPPWHHRDGWQCKPCEAAEKLAKAVAALTIIEEDGYDSIDCSYTDKVVCPHCSHSYEYDSGESPPEVEEVCDLCGGGFSIEPTYEVHFTTEIVGERVTLNSIKNDNIGQKRL